MWVQENHNNNTIYLQLQILNESLLWFIVKFAFLLINQNELLTFIG